MCDGCCKESVTQIETLHAIARVDRLCCTWDWALPRKPFVISLRTGFCERSVLRTVTGQQRDLVRVPVSLAPLRSPFRFPDRI